MTQAGGAHVSAAGLCQCHSLPERKQRGDREAAAVSECRR